MIRFLIFIWIFSANVSTWYQAPSTSLIYPEHILLAEEAIASEDFEEALNQYRDILAAGNQLLAKDAFHACQLAAILDAPDFTFYYLQCAKAGVPGKVLKGNIHIRPRMERDTSAISAMYFEGFKTYQSGIDTALRKEFIARYNREQSSKGKSNYAMVCEDNFNRIFQLAKAGRFPSENLIGPDDHLGMEFVLPTLLHYPYSYTYLKSYLLEALDQGHMSPFQVCYLYGFNQTRTSVLYTREIPVDHTNFKACYNIAFGRQSIDIPEVNAQRRLRYLPSVETTQKLKAVASKYLIDYREGY